MPLPNRHGGSKPVFAVSLPTSLVKEGAGPGLGDLPCRRSSASFCPLWLSHPVVFPKFASSSESPDGGECDLKSDSWAPVPDPLNQNP